MFRIFLLNSKEEITIFQNNYLKCNIITADGAGRNYIKSPMGRGWGLKLYPRGEWGGGVAK